MMIPITVAKNGEGLPFYLSVPIMMTNTRVPLLCMIFHRVLMPTNILAKLLLCQKWIISHFEQLNLLHRLMAAIWIEFPRQLCWLPHIKNCWLIPRQVNDRLAAKGFHATEDQLDETTPPRFVTAWDSEIEDINNLIAAVKLYSGEDW